MANTLYTTQDASKMIGQVIRGGRCFQQYATQHPTAAIIAGKADESLYETGKRLNFERVSYISGKGPRWSLDFDELVAQDLLLGSSGTNGEGAPVTFDFANPAASMETGWAAFQVRSTIYESDMIFQKGKALITEPIMETEGRRINSAVMKKLGSILFGTTLPDKNSWGTLNGIISDGLTNAARNAAYADRQGTGGGVDESAYKLYGFDSSLPQYANHRSYVKPWTSTQPSVAAMSDTIELVQQMTGGNPKTVILPVSNYQVLRDAIDTAYGQTGGGIIADFEPNYQEIGITGFSYRGNNFVPDYDATLYSPNQMWAIDPTDWMIHFNENIMSSAYAPLTGVLNGAYQSTHKIYGQLTCMRRRTQIKWVSN